MALCTVSRSTGPTRDCKSVGVTLLESASFLSTRWIKSSSRKACADLTHTHEPLPPDWTWVCFSESATLYSLYDSACLIHVTALQRCYAKTQLAQHCQIFEVPTPNTSPCRNSCCLPCINSVHQPLPLLLSLPGLEKKLKRKWGGEEWHSSPPLYLLSSASPLYSPLSF